MQAQKQKIIVIVGPTASGKSGLGVDIAHKFGGEIISADSRQVYRKLDIGTAKTTKTEMRGIAHHLIDIIDIDQSYSAEQFKRDASILIAEITGRGHVPIIVGGTFFYIDTLLGKISAPKVPPDLQLRKELGNKSADALYAELLKKDPRRAETIDQHNKRRLIRSLEIVQALGAVPPPQIVRSPYLPLVLGIRTPKDELRTHMYERGKQWLAHGFVKETIDLLASGISRERLAEMGFEYQLCMELIDGTLTKETFLRAFEEKNWQYAKRQLTWLKRDPTINWIYLSEKAEIEILIKQFLLN